MVDLARQNWRDYEVDGVAASGKHKPNKAKIRQWGTWVESVITAFTSNGGLVYATRTLLYADLLHGANTSAWVVSDSTAAYNGIYQKSGISGAGAWTRIADLPYSFIACADAGAGTANAIVATSNVPAPTAAGAALFICNVFEANTGAATLALNGATAKPIVTNSGNALSTGYLVAGMQVIFVDDGTNWRLVSDVASATIQAACIAAQDAAEDARDVALAAAASISLPAITANTMIVDNAAGTLRESKTFAQVRGLLDTPSYDDLYYIDGMDNGLTGNSGDDQTTALQNIIDNIVPTEGGIIKYRGYVDFTTIDLYGRRNIVFQGEGGNGAGAAQRSILRSTAGAIGTGVPAIKLWKTFGIGFEKTMVLASNAAFNGVLIDFNATTPTPGDDSALMHIRDTYVGVTSSSGVGLDLYGSTQGLFENNTFSGAGTLIKLQDVAGVGFCNVHRFGNSHIKPTGSNYPVLGSGEAITFDTCNVQASSSDHIGRFWLSSQNQAFKGITIRGCTTYDVTASGGISSYFYRGNGLNLFGNNFGGTSTGANYAMQIGGGPVGANDDGYGVSGFNVIGNNFEYLTAGVSFAGTAGNHNQARNGVFFGNTARGTMPAATHTIIYAGISSTKNVLVLPNFTLNTSTNAELLDCLYMYDWPNYANRAAAVSDGRTTGQVFKETTSGQGYLCVV